MLAAGPVARSIPASLFFGGRTHSKRHCCRGGQPTVAKKTPSKKKAPARKASSKSAPAAPEEAKPASAAKPAGKKSTAKKAASAPAASKKSTPKKPADKKAPTSKSTAKKASAQMDTVKEPKAKSAAGAPSAKAKSEGTKSEGTKSAGTRTAKPKGKSSPAVQSGTEKKSGKSGSSKKTAEPKAKPEAKPEAKPGTKADTKPEAKPPAKSSAKAPKSAKSDQADAQTASKPTSKPAPKAPAPQASPKDASSKEASAEPEAGDDKKANRKGITIVSKKAAKKVKPKPSTPAFVPPTGPLLGPGMKRRAPLIASGPKNLIPVADELVEDDSGKPRKSPFNKKQLDKYKLILIEKRRELVAEMNNLEDQALKSESGSLSNLPQHTAEQGSDTTEQSISLGMAQVDRQRIREIDAALQRIADGSYGVCVVTGKPISEDRLEELPWAELSIEAARARERTGRRP